MADGRGGKYEKLTLSELKEELRRRNAKISGRKAELVSRLEAYDRNSNFGYNPADDQPVYSMVLPDPSAYKDINKDMKLPDVTAALVNDYLTPFGVQMKEADNLYDNGFLTFVRAAQVGDVFLRSQCCAEMRKGVAYTVDIKLNNCGILESQCECAAGIGPRAHCKHIRAVMCALCDFTANNNLKLKLTCTQKLQSFHKTKPYLGSPLKSYKFAVNQNLPSINFDPRPSGSVNDPSYKSYVRNVTINFKASAPKSVSVPLTQLYPPANTYALDLDHHYGTKPLSQLFLDEIGVTTISAQQAASIEQQTRGQAQNEFWFLERCLRLQASKFGDICKTTNPLKMAKDLVTFKRVNAAAINHGRMYESQAIRNFESRHNVSIKRSGILVSLERPHLACSPDGLLDDCVVEVKCPYSARNNNISPETVPYLYLDEQTGLLALDKSHKYYYQIQGQLYISDRSKCHFTIFTLCDFCDIVVKRDEAFISQMCDKLDDFFETCFKAVLLEKSFYRNYDQFAFTYND